MLKKLALIAIAGGFGSLARYWLSGLAQFKDKTFPSGTLVVNLIGCFVFGVVWSLTEGRWDISPETRVIILVGFMGAFTTFSTFAFETGQMIQDHQYGTACFNVLIQVVVGVLALFAGMKMARLV